MSRSGDDGRPEVRPRPARGSSRPPGSSSASAAPGSRSRRSPRAAGVSRQLVYFHFESRAGLLVAMARRQDAAAASRRGSRMRSRRRPSTASRRSCARGTRTCRDPPGRARPRGGGRSPATRAAAAWRTAWATSTTPSAPRSSTSRRAAASRTAGPPPPPRTGSGPARQPGAYQHLVVERGWKPGDYVERAVASILSEVLGPGESARGRAPGRIPSGPGCWDRPPRPGKRISSARRQDRRTPR